MVYARVSICAYFCQKLRLLWLVLWIQQCPQSAKYKESCIPLQHCSDTLWVKYEHDSCLDARKLPPKMLLETMWGVVTSVKLFAKKSLSHLPQHKSHLGQGQARVRAHQGSCLWMRCHCLLTAGNIAMEVCRRHCRLSSVASL